MSNSLTTNTLNNKIKVMIFDWDGTLMDSIGQIVYCLMRASEELSLPLTEKEATNIIGLSLPVAMTKLFPQVPEQHELIIKTYAKYYVQTSEDKTTQSQLYAGAVELLDLLDSLGIQSAVATGKSRIGLNRVFDQTGLGRRFVISRCADETASKPNPLMLEQIMTELNATPDECIMVGDTIYDLQMAKNIGMARIGITHGVHNEQELLTCEPIAIFDELQELIDWCQANFISP